MSYTKRFGVYFKIPVLIDQRLLKLNKEISEKYKNYYLFHLSEAWETHVSIVLSCAPSKNMEEISEAIQKILEAKPKIFLEIDELVINKNFDYDYIFFKLTEESHKKLEIIHNEILEATNELRKKAIPEKYIKIWHNLTSGEKERLLNTGNRYEFESHITIAKVKPEDSFQSFNLVKADSLNMKGVNWQAEKVFICVEDDDETKKWPGIAEVDLI